MTDYNGPERRVKTIYLDAEAKEMISEMHTLLTDKNVGLCVTVKGHHEAIHGNGKMGIKTQILIMWILMALLGADSQLVTKVAKWIR